MKSLIDWNELIPLLPKQKRDDLYLEAVAILSERDEQSAPRKRKKNSPQIRMWNVEGDGHDLASKGRKFRINKLNNSIEINPNSKIGKVWEKVRSSYNDVITIEGLGSIAEGEGMRRASDVVWYLWARKKIDVVTE